MSTQITAYSPEFQAIIVQVEAALIQAAEDARELAERTGTPLVVREQQEIRGADPVRDGSNSQMDAREGK
ncbi:hypothetical protein FACS1894205_6660 [Alphaproteobacteria bacterium]|nr:hypothetical protein FACS1894205_6660 [Alphaproteobacteria bacterium]